jgi:hypothetical protein
MHKMTRFTAEFLLRALLLNLKRRVEPILYITSYLFYSFVVYLTTLSVAQNT